jgi:hypothetical protein
MFCSCNSAVGSCLVGNTHTHSSNIIQYTYNNIHVQYTASNSIKFYIIQPTCYNTCNQHFNYLFWIQYVVQHIHKVAECTVCQLFYYIHRQCMYINYVCLCNKLNYYFNRLWQRVSAAGSYSFGTPVVCMFTWPDLIHKVQYVYIHTSVCTLKI